LLKFKQESRKSHFLSFHGTDTSYSQLIHKKHTQKSLAFGL